MENTIELEQQQEVQISVTFSELQCFDSDDVATCVSKQTALAICNRCLEDSSAKIVEVLSLWLRKLLKAYIVNETECCIDVFKCLYEWFLRLKGDVTPENKDACSDFITLLADAMIFAEWAKDKLLQTSERLVHTTAFFLLALVYGCLQLSNENNVDALKEHEPLAIELHMIVLFLLRQITAISKKVHARITPLFRQLIEITDFLSVKPTHMHAVLKTSQTMTNICTHYSSSADSSTNISKDMPDWLQDTVLHLSDTVLNHLETVYQKDTLLVPVEKLEEYLKVTQAYLIMLHKLLSDVKHMDKSVLDTIILLLIGGETKPTHDLGKNIPMLMSKYVRPFVMQLYELIYPLEDFQKHLIAYLAVPLEAGEDCYELCLDFVTVTIIDDTEISQLTCQTLQKLFNYLFKDGYNFTNAARYARIMESFGSLLHLADSSALFNYFCMGIFQEDIIKSQVCADVLMLYFRLEEAHQRWNNNELQQATNFWIKSNNLYALHSQSLSQWHVQRMLKYFLKLSNSEPPIFNIKNYRHLLCVPAKTEQHQRLWLLRLQRILSAPLSDTEQYYEMLMLMELLSTGQTEWLQQLLGSLRELLLSDKCNRLLANVYFKLAIQSNRATQLRILQGNMPAKPIANSCWAMQRFLYACKRSGDAQLKSLAEQHTIATELLPLLDAVQPMDVYRQNGEQISSTYYKLTYRRNQTHNCNLISLKRKRCDNEPKDLIRQLEQNSEQLIAYSAELDANDTVQLRSIIENLKKILSRAH